MAPVWNPALLRGPLFASLHPLLERIHWPAGRWPDHADYQALLTSLAVPPVSGLGALLRVVPPLPPAPGWQQSYEGRLGHEGLLQTRGANWHDLFNLLVWAAFPRTKAALNRRHCLAQRERAEGGIKGRSPVEDALTQFDESGVVVVYADETLAAMMRAFRWKALFVTHRSRVVTHMACYLFGHGLLEKALAPYVGMTGKGILVPVAPDFFGWELAAQLSWLDGGVAQAVACLARPADLQPVPVLGFPGMTPDNERPGYYDDVSYFRPGRRRPPG
jgi:hypothetical protein